MSNTKNVESFGQLIGVLTGYGGMYIPGSKNLRVESVSDLLNRARAALSRASAAKTGYEIATNEREVAFAEVKQMASRILSELKSSEVLDQTVADAASMVRKMKGRVLAVMPAVVQQAEAGKATSSRKRVTGAGYNSVVYHFEKLIDTLMAEPNYKPSQPTLQVETLQKKLSALRASNAAVVTAVTELGVARRDRNALLYKGAGSVYKTAQAVKHQVRAIYGYSSEATQAASKIKFTKP
jgi:hypothetical protein